MVQKRMADFKKQLADKGLSEKEVEVICHQQLADKGLSEKEVEVICHRLKGIIKDDETTIYLSLVKRYSPSDPWPITKLFVEQVLNLTIPLPEKAPITTTSNEQQQLEKAIPENSIFFLDQYGKPFVHLQNVDHFENWLIKSDVFEALLTSWLKTAGISFSTEKIRSLQLLCRSKAHESNQKIELWNRYYRKNDEIYIDLGKPDWSILKISKNSIETLSSDAIMFRRYAAMAEMPIDLSGEKEDLEKYLNLVNLKNEDPEKERENKLLYSVLLGTMMIPGFPHPIILVNGPQGSAKSSFSRSIRIIIDPSVVPLLSIPNKIDNLIQTLSHNYAAFFDNVDSISDDYSDAFCRASTGEGIVKRQLYTDEEDIIFRYQRCVLLNGINISTTRSDFIDRSIQFELETIGPTQRKTENEIINELESLAPRVRGYLAKVVQNALVIYENTSKQLIGRLPRMADFAIWGEAISKAMGYQPLEFFNAYTTRISDLSKSVISENVVAIELLDYLNKDDTFSEEKPLEITPSELFDTLVERIKARGADPKALRFPGNASHLSRKLNLLKPNLEAIGIQFDNKLKKEGNDVARKIEFKKISKDNKNDNTTVTATTLGNAKNGNFQNYGVSTPLNKISLNTILNVKEDLEVLESGVSAVTKKDGVTGRDDVIDKQIGKNPVNYVNPVNNTSILTENDQNVLKTSVSSVISEDSVSGREVEKADKVDNSIDKINENAIGQPLKTSKIEFVQPMEAFIWKDGEHGPFEPPQRVEINAEIADILIRAGRAIPCETADRKDTPREVI